VDFVSKYGNVIFYVQCIQYTVCRAVTVFGCDSIKWKINVVYQV